MNGIRSALTLAGLAASTLVLGPSAFVAGRLGRGDLSDRCAVTWSRVLLALSGTRVTVLGLEHARDLGACVILSSHRSHLDGPILLRTLPWRFAFVIKGSLAKIPFFGPGLRGAGYIAIDRADHANALSGLRRAAEAVRDGRRVLVFPEGTRSTTGAFLPFKKGGVVLALQAGVPILPVAIAGTRALLASKSLDVRPGPAVVAIGAPIPTTGLAYTDRDDLLRRCEAEVRRLYAVAEAAIP
jgi:1-acyl-sn-glycerol-3-phosphate acyltransferase